MARFRNGIMEIVVDPQVLERCAQENVSEYFQGMRNSDKIIELREEIIKELHIFIDNNLTERQKDILKLYLQGKTQEEIGSELGIVQEGVCLQLNGIPDYSRSGKKYGGIIPKLRKLSDKSEKIQELLNEIRELRDN